MAKIKHVRTADCVVAGFRWHKNGPGTLVGSLLLGLYDDGGTLQHVGVTSSFTMGVRAQLAKELEPLRSNAMADHPWKEWAGTEAESSRMPGGQSRWSAGKDLSWEPLRIERVCEVKYDHLQGDRFRHAAIFQRWRPDRSPAQCRYDQLEVTPPAELPEIFRQGRKSSSWSRARAGRWAAMSSRRSAARTPRSAPVIAPVRTTSRAVSNPSPSTSTT